MKTFVVLAATLCLFIGSGTVHADPDEPPSIVATFYFGGTYMKGTEWKHGPAAWKTPSLWESMARYPAHNHGTLNSRKLKTYHRYNKGVGAGYKWLLLPGDTPHCLSNPRGWDEVHRAHKAGSAMAQWNALLVDEPTGKIIVNSVGQSRGGVSAIRFAGEVAAASPDRIAWINVISTDPVHDENAACLSGNDKDHTLDIHWVLPSLVRTYVGIYAEDERSADFHPVVPIAEDPATEMILMTVPGSHQTLVGNAQIDGHAPNFPLISAGGNKEDGQWKTLAGLVTYLVLELFQSYDFGFTEFTNGSSPGYNYLYWSQQEAGITNDAEWIVLMEHVRNINAGSYVQSVSFLPKGLVIGKLMTWLDANDACKKPLKYKDWKNGVYAGPRCGMVAKAVPTNPSDGKTADVGLTPSPEVHVAGQAETITIDSPYKIWGDIEDIIDYAPSFTIQTTLESILDETIEPSGSVTVPYWGAQEFAFYPAEYTQIANVLLDGVSVMPDPDADQLDPDDVLILETGVGIFELEDIDRDHTLHVSFEQSEPVPIVSSAGEGGEIVPSGKVTMDLLSEPIYTIRAHGDNAIVDILVDGISVIDPADIGKSYVIYLFDPVTTDHTIEAVFELRTRVRTVVSPSYNGGISGAGMDCNPAQYGFDCEEPVANGSEYDLTATPESGFFFAGWSGCDEQPFPGQPEICRMHIDPDPPNGTGNQRGLVAHFVGDDPDDPDMDGVSSVDESLAPDLSEMGTGDGNMDGMGDDMQCAVTSIPSPVNGSFCTIDTIHIEPPSANSLTEVTVQPESAFANEDPDYAYPFGVVGFKAQGVDFTMRSKIYFEGLTDSSLWVYRVFWPDTGEWFTVTDATFTEVATPSGGKAAFVSFEIVDMEAGPWGPPLDPGDGAAHDLDLQENNEVISLGGPALRDTDGDGIADLYERTELGTSPYDTDSDGDEIPDGEEEGHGCDPMSGDTNLDGVPDGEQLAAGGDPAAPDTDGDGMPNEWETAQGLDPLVDDAADDPDDDGKTNLEEFEGETYPTVDDEDWDKDGMPNDWEDEYDLDPTEDDAGEDPDGDGRSNLEEFEGGTDPSVEDPPVADDPITWPETTVEPDLSPDVVDTPDAPSETIETLDIVPDTIATPDIPPSEDIGGGEIEGKKSGGCQTSEHPEPGGGLIVLLLMPLLLACRRRLESEI